MTDVHTLIHSYAPGADAGPDSLLLVWDAPNLDMGLGAIPVSYTHLTLPTILRSCRSRWSPYH